ncbi:hypothetical protein EKO27_g3704 [Xylaria grammica]|uniref:Uncharacterized protein n=1 Tax=Xylaria grammica TaxID=363999 RepID=A0A439DAH7_9PEZI|nr:hypothetical protein EKO27_g3704 [Xylaria grammica]
MAASRHAPPAGRHPRPRRKSLEQLEAKYKALMRNMLMYQQMRKRNMCGGTEAGTNIKTEPGAAGGRMSEKTQQNLIYQAQQTLPTPSSSVSPTSSTTNLEDTNILKQNQPQQQSIQHHQIPTPALREQQRERPTQKRLQTVSSGPKPAYDRRDVGSSARHTRPTNRPMPAAIQLAYEELTSMQQQQQTPPPPSQHQQPHHVRRHHQHHQLQHQFQQQQPTQQAQQAQQPHQGSAPIPIPRPASIQLPPHYLQQQYMHHVAPHLHTHHQPLTSPLPTSPHLTASYTAHHSLPTISAPYPSYDNSGVLTHMDQQQHPHHPQPQQHSLPPFGPNSTVDNDLLDCFVSNMSEM